MENHEIAQIKDQPIVKNESPQSRDFVWDCCKHEDDLFTNRANFFLLSESMLFAGLATLIPGFVESPKNSEMILIILIIGCGLIISILWRRVSHLSIKFQRILKNELSRLNPDYKWLQGIKSKHTKMDSEDRPPKRDSVHWMMGIWLSGFFICIWITIPIVMVMMWLIA